MASDLISAFLRMARAVGRWIFDHIIRRSIVALQGYMAGKVDDFRRRLRAARSHSRQVWLRGRIRRWSYVLRLLDGVDRDPSAKETAAFVAQKAVELGIPLVDPRDR